MLAQSAAHAQVFVLQRLSAFPDHIGHTEHNQASFLKELAVFFYFLGKNACCFLKKSLSLQGIINFCVKYEKILFIRHRSPGG